jgi:RNA polymerase sigma-70 factor (ECF subfamily)
MERRGGDTLHDPNGEDGPARLRNVTWPRKVWPEHAAQATQRLGALTLDGGAQPAAGLDPTAGGKNDPIRVVTRSVVLSTSTTAGTMTVSRTDERTDALQREALRERTLETFFEAHYRRLVGLAGLVCGDISSAEDIVQTALERAWRSRGSLEDDVRLRSWLDRIVVREAARERRARRMWLSRVIRPVVGDMGADYAQIEDPAADSLVDRTALRSAFEGLTVAQRAVVVLHLHAGYTVEETAAALGVPRETVRSRLRVAREHLRHVLGSDAR